MTFIAAMSSISSNEHIETHSTQNSTQNTAQNTIQRITRRLAPRRSLMQNSTSKIINVSANTPSITTHQCKGTTTRNKQCLKTIPISKQFCVYHEQTISFKFEKPDECIICLESLTTTDRPLDCGHWIHTSCVALSGKDVCPVCRQQVHTLSENEQMIMLQKQEEQKDESQRIDEEFFTDYILQQQERERQRAILNSMYNNHVDGLLAVIDDETQSNDDMTIEVLYYYDGPLYT